MLWDPERYEQFSAERAEPFEDLLALVTIRQDLRVVDLGCGTGVLTQKLADALPSSEVLGVDSSAAMLERTDQLGRPGLRFEYGDIRELEGQWDLVFSHSAIQWLPDHHTLIPRLLAKVSSGGQLAVQQPSNHRHAVHKLLSETASEEPFQAALEGWTRQSPVLSLEEYANLLYSNGGTAITVMEKIYPHVLESADAIADWMSGTGMRAYLKRLPPDLHDAFREQYRRKLRSRWPSGPVFYPLRRMLFAVTLR
jgi:trans-aconitate 2-methyltransferase